MASSLREELASLRIERPSNVREPITRGPSPSYRRRGFGLRIFSLMFWLIPLGVVSVAATVAYKQYEQIRSKPEVTIGLVQTMTLGEAEKLLSSKGYLKSRYQAMIGTKIAGRVEEMRVHERATVKKGEILAVIEHHDMDAMLLQRKAGLIRAEAELEEAKVELWDKDRQEKRLGPAFEKQMTPQEDLDKAVAAAK